MAEWALVLPNNTTLGLTENNDLAVVGISGAGMPPINNVYTSYGLADGALYQRAAVQPRLVTILVDAAGTSWVGLHNLRAKLIEAVNPHEATPITVKYSAGGSKPDLYLDCYYDSGLEGGVTEGFMEKGMALRLLATDPYWEAAAGTAHTLGVQAVIDTAYNALMLDRATGEWSALISGTGYLDGDVRALALTPSPFQDLWVGGAFTNKIGLWTGGTAAWNWDISASDTVYAAQYLPTANGGYAAGAFTTYYGDPHVRIAILDGGALGSGLSDTVYGLWTPDGGKVYVGGAFDTAGGTAAHKVALWDGAKWNALGTGVSGTAYAVDGKAWSAATVNVYFGGAFTTAGGIAVNHVALLDAQSSWRALGAGMSGDVNALHLDDTTNMLYAGGDFTTAGSVTANNVARWNGAAWEALDQGLNNEVNALWMDSDGVLYAGGAFTASGAGDPLLSGAAKYQAGIWVDAGEGQLTTGAPTIYAITGDDDYLFIGGSIDGEWTSPDTTTINNPGTARAYPKIVVTGPGQLYFVRNNTTGQELRFDLMLFTDETLTIDFSPGVKTVTSNFRGNMISAITSGNLIDFWLAPGDNSLSCWVANSTATATYQFTARYWSSDGKST